MAFLKLSGKFDVAVVFEAYRRAGTDAAALSRKTDERTAIVSRERIQ
jgi:hypothetical protein